MKDVQMNPDAAIDRVLMGLASVEAPRGIEQRVLSAVQLHAAERKTPGFVMLFFFASSRPWAIAACVVVLSVAASVAVHKRHELKHEDAGLLQHTTPSVQLPPPIGIAEAQSANAPRHNVPSTSPRRGNAERPEDINDLDALAVAEMNAPSKPAPPLPLTHQEELLAGVVHQDSPIDLSSLRPEVRAKQMELSKAEFHDFFDPPPAKDNE
jgi:hypothetical protein